MKVLFAVFVGLSLPNLALANFLKTSHPVIVMWWSFLLAAVVTALWFLILLIVLVTQVVKRKKIELPRLMKIGILTTLIFLGVGFGLGKYQDQEQTKKDNQCVLDCLQCTPGSNRARIIEWGGHVVKQKCKPMENTCENWHTCAMVTCGFEPIRPVGEYCPR